MRVHACPFGWYNAPMPHNRHVANTSEALESNGRDRDYVLGTHDAEVERLRFQHSVWRDEVQRAWIHAGIGRDSRVIDVGAGPGFASLDLAELVGPAGRVLAAERSARFLGILAELANAAGHANIDTAEIDLMTHEIPGSGFDAAWCRWVACFVPDPGRLVDRVHAALRPGGAAVFHEYVEYASYQLLPPSAPVRGFVDAVFESWRSQGGEPNIARTLPRLLTDRGFEIRAARPIALAARPSDRLWNWPAGFIRTNVPRLVELGIRDEAWGRAVLDAVTAAERDAAAIFVTPTVLEIIATKR
jgi:SAM-dependent methyltransferase